MYGMDGILTACRAGFPLLQKVCKMLPKWHHRLVYPSSYITPCFKRGYQKKKKKEAIMGGDEVGVEAVWLAFYRGAISML